VLPFIHLMSYRKIMLFVIRCVRNTEGVAKFILFILDLVVNVVTTET